ncbi:hypothetical protein D3C87_1509830 [compost metagenome]
MRSVLRREPATHAQPPDHSLHGLAIAKQLVCHDTSETGIGLDHDVTDACGTLDIGADEASSPGPANKSQSRSPGKRGRPGLYRDGLTGGIAHRIRPAQNGPVGAEFVKNLPDTILPI